MQLSFNDFFPKMEHPTPALKSDLSFDLTLPNMSVHSSFDEVNGAEVSYFSG